MPPPGHAPVKMLHRHKQPCGRFWNIKMELTLGDEVTLVTRPYRSSYASR